MIRYKNTQIGWVMLAVVLIISGVALVTVFNEHSQGKEWNLVLSFMLLTVLLLFHSLTTIVTDDRIIIYFGIGAIRKVIPIEEIIHSEVKKNQWILGWGIRIGRGFVLWNVSGFDAVELTLQSRKWKFRVGTDKPEELHNAIRVAIQERQLLVKGEE